MTGYSIQIKSSTVNDAEKDKVKLANLRLFGVADNIRNGLYSKYFGERLLGEDHGAITPTSSSKWQKMVAPHLFGSSPLLPTCRAISLPKIGTSQS